MEPEISLPPDFREGGRARDTFGRMLPGLAICVVGVLFLLLAQGQPAWLGGQVGPGLMARLLGGGVIGLGAVWAVVCALGRGAVAPPEGCGHGSGTPGPGKSGPALLGAVLVFALALPMAGMVLSAGLAAALAAWGAGERKPRALAVTVAGLMALVAVIGVLLLPPAAPLWPVV